MLKIDVYADIVCPWCIIGQHRLDKVLRERFPDLDVEIEHHPYELQPGAPPEGLRLDAYFRAKGISDLQAAFARPEAEARMSGLKLDLASQPFVYRTVHAHTLLRHARGRGTQHALSQALMQAFFNEHRNISDKDVLAQIAGAVAWFSVPQPRQVACTGKPTRYSCPRAKRRCMRPSRHTPRSLSQRVQRHSEFEVVGLVFAAPDQLVGAAWREGKGVGIEVLL